MVALLVCGQIVLGAALSPLGKIAGRFPSRAWGSPDMVVQAAASALVLGLLWLYMAGARGARRRDAGLVSRGLGRDALHGLGYAVLAFVLGAAATIAFWTVVKLTALSLGIPGDEVDKFLLKSSAREQETARGVMSALGIVVAVLIAPVTEELVFRSALFRGLRCYANFWPAAALSAAVFTGLHFYVAGAPMIFVMGLVAAWSVERRGSIVPALFMHAIWNLRVFVVLWSAGW